jgi:hypothetical protein
VIGRGDNFGSGPYPNSRISQLGAPTAKFCRADRLGSSLLLASNARRVAIPKLCSFTSMRSQPKSLLALTLSSFSIRPAGMAPRPSRFQATSRSCSCRHARPNSMAKKISGNLCGILRRYRRSLLLRLEHADRSAVENHVHRATRLDSSRSLNLRIGIRRSELARVALAKEPRRRQQNGQMIKSFKLFAWLVLVAFSAAAFRAAIPNH